MSKKDYELIAATFRSWYEHRDSEPADLATCLADAFAARNEQFKREAFLKACGVT